MQTKAYIQLFQSLIMGEELRGAIASFIGIIIFILGGAFLLGGLIGLLFGAGLFAIF